VEPWAATNTEQARYWNSDEAGHWLVHEERYERMLAPFTEHLLAGRAATQGQVLGVDLSSAMLRRAARRAHDDGHTRRPFRRLDIERWMFNFHDTAR
jgi:SAM-dependent methyltransferase